TGLGSIVARLPAVPSSWRFLVICPPVDISTRAVYEAVDGSEPTAHRTPTLVRVLEKGMTTPHPDPPPQGGREMFGNDLEPASRRLFPALDQAIERLRAAVPDMTMTGTDGKTTTAALLRHILEAQGRRTVANQAGANLIFGVTAAMVNRATWSGGLDANVGLFEIDEASLPRLVQEIAPGTIIVTNLFRDQLDRYGELETTAAHIRRALVKGPEGVTAVLNADDPMVAALGDGLPRVVYAGLDDPTLLQPELSHGADAKFCPRCGSPFVFDGVYFGHVGHYHCPRGDFARPSPDVRATSVAIEGMERMRLRISDGAQEADVVIPLSGLYNTYNVVLAIAAARALGVPVARSAAALRDFTPASGRMERTMIDGRPAVLLLVQNAT